jgi:hypothetical protein
VIGRLAVLAALAALAVAGCGGKPPEISVVEWRLETRPAESGPAYESLSVFASLKDENGLDNIVELWVLHDDSALAWKLTNADWIKATEGGDDWIGGSSLTTPELAGMPRGGYRLIAIDAAGQRAEKEFRVSGSFPDKKAPSVSYSGEKLTIGSPWPETLALAFDGTGALIASPEARALASSLSTSFGRDVASRTAEVGAYGYDPSLRMGAFSPRIKTR